MLVKIFYNILKINESTYSISLTYKLGFFVFKLKMNYPAVPKRRDEVSRLKMAFHHVILACPESLLIVIAACLQSFFEE